MILSLEAQVCSLQLSKRLKELGTKQESLFYWTKDDWPMIEFCTFAMSLPYEAIICSAFTVAELENLISTCFTEWAQGWNDCGCFWQFSYGPRGSGGMIDGIGKRWSDGEPDTEANSRARFLIHLLENKLIKLEEVGG